MTQIDRLPALLLVHLQQFSFNTTTCHIEKRTDPIHIPTELRLSDSFHLRVYSLMAIVVHLGDHHNGHFVTFSRRGDHWLLFDDNVVYLADIHSIRRCFTEPGRGQCVPYILVYNEEPGV